MATATLITGSTSFGADAQVLQREATTARGVRDYLIDTPVINAACWTATGLPQPGDAWDGTDAPTLIVVGQDFKRVSIAPNGSGGYVGNVWARVRYETLGTANRTTAPVLGLKYSRWQSGTISILQTFDADWVNTSTSAPITNGDGTVTILTEPIDNARGVQRNIGTASVVVTNVIAEADYTLALRTKIWNLIRAQAVNSDSSITIPREAGSTTGLSATTISAGQAQLVSFEPTFVNGLVKIDYTLNIAEDFFYRWQSVDARGFATGTRRRNRLYPALQFMGTNPLW